MKNALKVLLISTASLLVILIIAICIVLWFVFTPEKLTPIVRAQTNKYITCPSEIGKVELTFFSTFPNFGVKVNHFLLLNSTNGSQNDTLVGIDQLVAVVDLAAWLKRDEIKIDELVFTNGIITIFSDSLGNTNYDIFTADTLSPTENQTETKPIVAELKNLKLDNIRLSYIDLSMKLNTNISNLKAEMSGTVNSGIISSNIKVDQSIVSLEYDGEKYIDSVSVTMDFTSSFWLSVLKLQIEEASGTLSDVPFHLIGSFEENTKTEDLVIVLSYEIAPSPVDKLLKMVPPSYQHYFEGITVEGKLAVEGKITGAYNDSVMPIFDNRLVIEDGTVSYEPFELPLHNVNGDVTISTDMTDAQTFVRIDKFEAETPKSSFSTKGLVTDLFSAISCDLTTVANLTLDEFNTLIPSDLKIELKGSAKGEVKSAFSMEQVEKMQIDKMKLSGAITLSNFDAIYDSLTLKTDFSEIEFSLPNAKASEKNTRFVFANINSKNLVASKMNSYSTKILKPHLIIEASDLRDTSRIPNFICSFSMDSLSASMDTLSIAVGKPAGRVVIFPQPNKPDQPHIRLTGNTQQMEACMGKDVATIRKLNFDTDIINQKEQKDIFRQWLVKGFFDMDRCNISMARFSHRIEIPSIKMDFTPEAINIKEGKLKIDRSDFQLSGNLKNVLSYFRNDSILRGSFNFTSGTTDVSQLMALTSGIGSEEKKLDSATVDTTYSGPYMVPKGMDIILNANIGQAMFGKEIATNISGEVRVLDGMLLLEDVNLTTPAARMQLTAMYRTPRKNHLFLGLDYHMFDIEIEELLNMIPDIDSLMPMLRSFKGKGEFHLAIETYLDSMYNLKKSTLRGASSITGQDLVLMDGETFSEIAKKLMFNKKTENKVDSLSAEFTIFRDEIDIYPFLIVMDKYKAVVAGRHNFDLSFDYHISVVDCPLPVKLGVDVKGTMDNMNYSLAKCKYAELYRPSSRKVVANKQFELRKLIREAISERLNGE
jgi:hypothetical protein